MGIRDDDERDVEYEVEPSDPGFVEGGGGIWGLILKLFGLA